MLPYLHRIYSSLAMSAVVLLLLVGSAPVCAEPGAGLRPPRATRIPQVTTRHGDTRVDNYWWLRHADDPAVQSYLRAENAYTEAWLRPLASLSERLFLAMKDRVAETDLSVPDRLDPYEYYSREATDCEYKVHCRRRLTASAPEEILLDENELASGQAFFALGAFRVSPNQALLAFSADYSGGEDYTLCFKDLTSGQLLPDRIPAVNQPDEGPGVVWGNDNRTVFYVERMPGTNRPWRARRHRLGEPVSKDVVLFAESEGPFCVEISKTRDGSWIVLWVGSATSSECWLVPADRPDEPPRLFRARRPGTFFLLEHHDRRFFMLTNAGAPDFRIVTVPDHTWDAEPMPFLPERPGEKIEEFTVLAGHLVVISRREALRRLRFYDFAGDTWREASFNEPVYSFVRREAEAYATTTFRLAYWSLITPETVIDLDLTSGQYTIRKKQEVPGYDPARYRCERIWAVASDGERIPLAIAYRADFVRDGKRPCLLYGYGAYGGGADPGFAVEQIALLDRGWCYVHAHVRGSEDMGRRWYDQGHLQHKRNTFTDFVACAEHLVRQRYTTPARLVINGCSAGGLLMGAVTNMRPDLFRVVLADVPFVDAINTQLDPTIPLVVEEYEEWGNPARAADYRYMKSYSPYDNVRPQRYPAMFVTAGLNDPRVKYWEPVKWVAKLRSLKTDREPLLLKVNMDAGHFSVSGRLSALQAVAQQYAFMFHVLGLDADGKPVPREEHPGCR